MTIQNSSEMIPKPGLDPRPAVAPGGWEILASKKVDDISKHESRHDIKKDPRHGITPKPEDRNQPGAPLQGGKPKPENMKK